MPYKPDVFEAEIRYVARRPLTYGGQKLGRGDGIPFAGARNDDRIADTLARQEISFSCRRPRCSKKFPTIGELVRHEKEHDEEPGGD